MILGMGGLKITPFVTLELLLCSDALTVNLYLISGNYRLQTWRFASKSLGNRWAVNNAGIVIDWFINNIAKGMNYEDLNKEAMKVSAGQMA